MNHSHQNWKFTESNMAAFGQNQMHSEGVEFCTFGDETKIQSNFIPRGMEFGRYQTAKLTFEITGIDANR